jgi:osmotically-inducible protein OsmY
LALFAVLAGLNWLISAELGWCAENSPMAASTPAMTEESMPPSTATPVNPAGTSSVTPAAMHTPAPAKAVPAAEAAPARKVKLRHVAHRKSARQPEWVLRSKVELAMHSDARFSNVAVEVTRPGVVVLRGTVFDDKTKAEAESVARNVGGVKQVINALSTETLVWLQTQIKINQALQQAGLKMVTAKVVGKTVYLSGVVTNPVDKQRAQTVALGVAPNLEIGTNIITISP